MSLPAQLPGDVTRLRGRDLLHLGRLRHPLLGVLGLLAGLTGKLLRPALRLGGGLLRRSAASSAEPAGLGHQLGGGGDLGPGSLLCPLGLGTCPLLVAPHLVGRARRTASSAFSLRARPASRHLRVGLPAGPMTAPDLLAVLLISRIRLALLGTSLAWSLSSLARRASASASRSDSWASVGRLPGPLQPRLEGVRTHRERVTYGSRHPSGAVAGPVGCLLSRLREGLRQHPRDIARQILDTGLGVSGQPSHERVVGHRSLSR